MTRDRRPISMRHRVVIVHPRRPLWPRVAGAVVVTLTVISLALFIWQMYRS